VPEREGRPSVWWDKGGYLPPFSRLVWVQMYKTLQSIKSLRKAVVHGQGRTKGKYSPHLAWVFFSSPPCDWIPAEAAEDGRVGASHAAEIVDVEWVFGRGVWW
jgi:hypothetical protein